MNNQTEIDLDKIATEYAENTVSAISVANDMGLVNEKQDLRELIKAGIVSALEDLSTKLNSTQK